MYEENLKGTVSLQFVTRIFPCIILISSAPFPSIFKNYEREPQISFPRLTFISKTPAANLVLVSMMPAVNMTQVSTMPAVYCRSFSDSAPRNANTN
jgi:hypothetical protein